MPAKNEAAVTQQASNPPSEEVVNNERSTVVKAETSHKKDDSLVNEDPLKGLVPLGPLGLFSNARQPANGKPTHQLPFSSKIDQFSSAAMSNVGGGGGTTIAANATTLFQQQGRNNSFVCLCMCNSIHLANANGSSYNLHTSKISLSLSCCIFTYGCF